MKNKLSLFFLLIFLGACSGKDEVRSNLEGGYYLNILYGTTENYTGNDGQWLNVYQAESRVPTPVYIWAHGNGHSYMDAHEKNEPFITSLLENGISVISWESIKQMDESNFMKILDDADLMFQWVKDNAQSYNLDMTKVFIGGIPEEQLQAGD